MANFKTHLLVAAGFSVSAAITLAGAQQVTPEYAMVLAALGTTGGLLPDIDADNSIIESWLFQFLAIACGFLLAFVTMSQSAILVTLLAWLAGYSLVQYIARPLLNRFSVHRGMIHSLPMAALSGLITSAISLNGFGLTEQQAWYSGLFVGCGFLLHLLLDELCSVDISSVKIKRSFGTACKLLSFNAWLTSSLLYLAVACACYYSPNWSVLPETIFNQGTLAAITSNFLAG